MRVNLMRPTPPSLLRWLSLLLCASLSILGACDDSSTSGDPTSSTDTSSGTGDGTSGTGDGTSGTDDGTSGTTSGTVIPPGQFKIESENPAAEFPDCILDCTNAATTEEGTPKNIQELSALKQEGFDGYAATIDGNCHDILIDGSPSKGPDTDIFTLSARARSLVEVIVQPNEGSPMEPTIYTHDGTAAMTFGGASDPGQPARTVFAAPHLGFLPFFFIVQDAKNEERFATGGPFVSCDGFVGGPSYGYTMKINILPFTPTDLTSGETLSDQKITQGGDIIYYKFTAPSSASPTIELVNTSSNTQFQPALIIMSTPAGQLFWNTIRLDGNGQPPADGNADGKITTSGGFITCASDDTVCKEGTSEFMFAVMDWNGRGGADFTFNITATY